MTPPAKRLLCLVNSRSGGNKGREIAKQLSGLSLSSIDKIEVKLLDGLASLPPTELIEREYAAVLIAGGDGTFSSVLCHYSGSKIEFILLPLGTGNDLARELGIIKLWKQDLQNFLTQSLLLPAQTVQVWQAEFNSLVQNLGSELVNKNFINYISFGWDGVVIGEFDRLRTNEALLSGKFGSWGNRFLYIIAGLRYPFYKLPAVTLEMNSKEIQLNSKITSLIFSNICSVMGLGKTNFISNCSDNLIELSVTKGIYSYFKMFLPKLLRSNNSIQGESFTIRFSQEEKNIPTQIDGEYYCYPMGGLVNIKPAGTVLVRFSKT